MNLIELNVFLIEGRIDDLKAVYVGEGPNKIPEHLFNMLLQIDPSENKKYFQWMCIQMAKEQGSTHEKLSSIKTLIPLFHDLIKRNRLQGTEKDIMTYPKIESLFDKIHWIDNNPTESESLKKIKEEGINRKEVVFENKNALVLRPRSRESSIIYGSGTKWCISAKDTKERDWFTTYFYNNHYTIYDYV